MRVKGQAQQTQMQKALRGGPQSLLPLSPVRGSMGTNMMAGLTPMRMRSYIGKQNPLMSPRGLSAMTPGLRMKFPKIGRQ